MARKPRIHVAAGVYHVMLRGNGGQDIFFSEADRYQFYRLVEQGIERYGHRIHGFCCMTNHVHLAVQVADEPLSRILQNLSFRYTRWINKRAHRIGHLFQGRYKAILVDADSYLLELVRYIHLNPVRAKLVSAPGDYPWSSHRAYLGEDELPWLTTDWVLGQFARRLGTCRKRYQQFMAAGSGEEHRKEFQGGGEDPRVLADERFLEKVTGQAKSKPRPPSLQRIVRYVCGRYDITPSALTGPSRSRGLSEARALIGWLARQTGAGTLAEIAAHFNRDATTLSRQVGRIELEARSSTAYAKVLNGHINALTQA